MATLSAAKTTLYNNSGIHMMKRYYSSNSLTHTDNDGNAKMVNIDEKSETKRFACASATVFVGPKISGLIQKNLMKKGDVLSITQLAGIIGAKKTSELIPLCHNIPLSYINVKATLDDLKNEVKIITKIKCEGKTGVEMEALVSASVAALTVYDMCKAISHDIIIKDIRLMEKYGGKKHFKRDSHQHQQTEFKLKYNTEPIDKNEPFYPIHI